MKTYIFFLLLAVSANATALSTSRTSALIVANMNDGITIHDQGKRLLRGNERRVETSDEERTKLPQETIDYLSQMEKRAEPTMSEAKRARALEIVQHFRREAERLRSEEKIEKLVAALSQATAENIELKKTITNIMLGTKEGLAIANLGGTIDDMIAVAVPIPKTVMTSWWGLDTDLVAERERMLQSIPNLEKLGARTLENMAIGSVYNFDGLGHDKGKGKQVSSHKYSPLVERFFDSLLQENEGFFDSIVGQPTKVSRLAHIMYHNEPHLPDIPAIMEMALGKIFFRILERGNEM